jgi:hypothetical protein
MMCGAAHFFFYVLFTSAKACADHGATDRTERLSTRSSQVSAVR